MLVDLMARGGALPRCTNEQCALDGRCQGDQIASDGGTPGERLNES
jgi:hypothetical protein